MERTISVEDRIKRAEEIYYRKKQNLDINYNSTRVPINPKKDYKLFKKLGIQVLVCLIIYFVFYYIVNNNYVFSEGFTNKAKEVLSYDIDLAKIYNNVSNSVKTFLEENKKQSNEEENLEENNTKEETKTGEEENTVNEEQIEENKVEEVNLNLEENNSNEEIKVNEEENIGGAEEVVQELSQMEQDCADIKKITNFIVPVEGYISSKFGWREATTSSVPKNHTGLDIAATIGTEIKSATNGTVILVSTEGDYGNHIKIELEDIILVYAHCRELYVKEGDYVVQGQKIAEVGSTGNSTGPHLHFEIRKSERLVDPQMILDI